MKLHSAQTAEGCEILEAVREARASPRILCGKKIRNYLYRALRVSQVARDSLFPNQKGI